MPTAEVTITVWICNLCGKTISRKGNSLLAEQEFIDVLRWLQLDEHTVFCERCRHVPDVVNAVLAHEKAAAL